MLGWIVVRNLGRQAVLLLFLLLLLYPALAYIRTTPAIVTPANGSVVNVTQNLSINLTFSGTANITININNTDNATDVYHLLNRTLNQASLYNFTFNTSNGSFADGRYNISILIQNSTNATDNTTLFISNITIDNTPPTVFNVRTMNASYGGSSYVNGTPVFTANMTENLSGLYFCEFAKDSVTGLSSVGTALSGNNCTVAPGVFTSGTVLNITFRGTDNAYNVGPNSSRLLFTVDADPPTISLNPVTGIYGINVPLNITANVSDAGVNITNGTACAIVIGGSTSGFTSTVKYTNLTNTCNGTITFSSNYQSGLYDLQVFVNDSVNNLNVTNMSIEIDNTPPRVTAFSYNKSNPADTNEAINLTATVVDSTGVARVNVTNGILNMTLSLTGGSATNGGWSALLNASFFGCGNESACSLRIIAYDTLGNLNSTVNTTFYVDAYAPLMLSNRTNATTAGVGYNITISARWRDIAILGFNISSVLELFNASTGNFTLYDTVNVTPVNATNFSYIIGRAFEGQVLTVRITLNDTNNHANSTANMTITIANQSPTFAFTPVNRSYITQNDTILFSILEPGIGINISTLLVQINSTANYTINYSANASLFNCSCTDGCGTSYANGIENTTCRLQTIFPLNNFTLGFQATDLVGNNGSGTAAYYAVNETPEIVNVTINGVQVTNGTPDSIAVSITNASAQVSFNWSVLTSFTINTTSISLIATPDRALSGTTPALALYNLSAGRTYLKINVSVNPTAFTDVIRINLTANIPLNLTAVRQAHLAGHGLSDFNVTESGTDLSGTVFVNRTLDVLLTWKNTTSVTPITATFDFSGLNGLSLRWNGTGNDFNITTGNATDYAGAAAEVGANITHIIKNAGVTSIFFDNATYLLAVGINASATNRSFYYSHRNSTESSEFPRLYLLRACSSAPSSPVAPAASCYVAGDNATTLYLARFDQLDEIIIAEPPTTAPSLQVITGAYNQSIIPLSFRVSTPFPADPLCSYNITKINSTNQSVPYASGAVGLSSFTLDGEWWTYNVNITDVPDYRYNETVNCTDRFNRSASVTVNFTVNDSTAPILSGSATGIGLDAATLLMSSDEAAAFTVKYGTAPGQLTSTANGNGLLTTDSIYINNLSVNTAYYYNITACDAKSLCTTIGPLSFTTLTPSGSSVGGAGGSGGIGATGTPIGVEASDGKVWVAVGAGQAINYTTRSEVAFTKLQMRFTADADDVKITVRQYKAKPANIPAASVDSYKYLSIDHVNTEAATERVITFKVPQAWAKEHAGTIALYRLEGDVWKRYAAQKQGETKDALTYSAAVPGFSFFFIGAYAVETAAVPVPVTAPPNQTKQAAPVEEKPTTEFVSDLEKPSFRIPAWIIITLVAVLAVAGSYVGLQQYKRYQHDEVIKQQRLREEGERMRIAKEQSRAPEHDPMKPVHDFIMKQRAKGVSDDEIRKKLLSVGWDELVVHMELMRR